MRIGLFGGTFDPVHRGHLALATAAADRFALDRVLFAPTGHQPLKPEGATAEFGQRLAMVALACTFGCDGRSDPRLMPSTVDAPRADGEPNYTIDTVAGLGDASPAAQLFVLAGADAFLGLARWRAPQRLLALAEWIVVSRPGSPFTADYLEREEFAPLALSPEQKARIHLLATVHEDVSSTELRERLGRGDPCPGLLPPAVAAYIQTHRLYR